MYHVLLDGRARDLSIVEDLQSLETLAGGDVSQTVVGDLHTAVQLQDRQVLRDGRARTQAADALVRDPATVRHALHATHDNTPTSPPGSEEHPYTLELVIEPLQIIHSPCSFKIPIAFYHSYFVPTLPTISQHFSLVPIFLFYIVRVYWLFCCSVVVSPPHGIY